MTTDELLAELNQAILEHEEAALWLDRAKSRMNRSDERLHNAREQVRRRLRASDAVRDGAKPEVKP